MKNTTKETALKAIDLIMNITLALTAIGFTILLVAVHGNASDAMLTLITLLTFITGGIGMVSGIVAKFLQ